MIAELFVLTEGYPQRISNAHNQYQPVYALLVELLVGGWHWLRDHIDHTTIETAAVAATAIFTATLWRATTRLWDSAEHQLVEFRKSLEQARGIADQHGEHLAGSVAEASRSATALEGVAASIAANGRGTQAMYLYGTVFFTDVFNEQQHVNFCSFGVWDVGGRFSTRNTNRHNDAT